MGNEGNDVACVAVTLKSMSVLHITKAQQDEKCNVLKLEKKKKKTCYRLYKKILFLYSVKNQTENVGATFVSNLD